MVPPFTDASASPRPVEGLRFENRFVASLPGDPRTDNTTRQVFEACHSHVTPTPVPAPRLLALVPEVAAQLDLAAKETPTLTAVLAGNLVLPGMKPYSACYGGHQFGSWAGQLGDGRAITLAEVVNDAGARYELQLKGAGPTPYSRRADGRAVLRSSLRELVCSEAMFHLGVPTTRALSLVGTGALVERDMLYDGNPTFEPGAIVCRVAPSFLRFGSFELHAARKDRRTLEALLRYTLDQFYPQFVEEARMNLAGFLEEVVRRTARMVLHWMRVGFVHGVMNTDNMSVLGLTIDYGPYGWVEPFDPHWTPNITDAQGRRYRFGHQPQVAFWNLLQFAAALAQLQDDVAPLEEALKAYKDEFEAGHRRMMLGKLGLTERAETAEDDERFIDELFALLMVTETDMTLFYRLLTEVDPGGSVEAAFEALRGAYYVPDGAALAVPGPLARWLEGYAARVAREGLSPEERKRRMDAVNPLYVPRNYLVQQVIEKVTDGNEAALVELLDVLKRPYEPQPGRESFAAKRPEWARRRPGCSMLSCSS